MTSLSGPAPVVQSLSQKVCLLGDHAVGKSSLVRRFVHDRFDDSYLSTIGVKVSRKLMYVPLSSGMAELVMMIWDLAGGEPLGDLRRSYLRGAAGAVLVADLTRPDTLDNLRRYAADLRSVCPDARLVILVNKSDLAEHGQVDQAALKQLTVDLQASPFTTSAKTGATVEAAFRYLGQLLVEAVEGRTG